MNESFDIYGFLDYREMLSALFEEKKKHNPKYSYRVLAAKAGFNSAGFFTKILKGQSNISRKTLLNLASAFNLNRQQTDYFEMLVNFNQAKSHLEQKSWFEQLLAMRRGRIRTLEQDQYQLFEHWYYVAIRELLSYMRISDNYEMLAAIMEPAIKPAEAKKAVQVLQRLGLIHKDPDGYWVRTDSVISTGENWRSFAIQNFQLSMMDRAKNALETIPTNERDVSTATISVSGNTALQAADIIKECRRRILELARNDNAPERVYQLNVQFFPLSRGPL
jgi:uncharacterized protein (TIGR02147 family)